MASVYELQPIVFDDTKILSTAFTCQVAGYLGAHHVQSLERPWYVICMRM